MSDLRSHSATDPAALHPDLTDRVLARVHVVAEAMDRRAQATRPKAAPRSAAAPDAAADQLTPTPERARELRSLRRVFHDLGDSYRQYLRRTGAPVSPEVRDAAYQFRRELNLSSLVSVAARLDELKILTW